MSRAVRGLWCLTFAALALAGCSATTDSLGYNDTESKTLFPVTQPASYPNPFRDLLGETDAAISAKVNNAFNTIFHGSNAYAIYVTAGDDEAFIEDPYHDNEVRTEGIGLGMMICVEFNKQDEFDKLWRYARDVVQNHSGPDAGYFPSFCDAAGGSATSCLDPYGFEQFVTALIFANDRWGSTGAIDYAADALALFHTLRHKEDDNGGGVVDGVTNIFDAATDLPLDVPNIAAAGVTRPSLVMPGYYALWGQADADPVWLAAAASGRAFLQNDVNATTGFVPVRASLDGTPLASWATFQAECYRAQINVVIDQIWSGGNPWNVTESNQLLAFFSGQGSNYGRAFSLDGTTVLDSTHDLALVAANGISALASTNSDRTSYVNAVWNLDPPTGSARYYSGLLQMVALLILSGQFQVY